MLINFLDFFKKKKIPTNTKLNDNLILKLVFELKKYLLEKDIFYDITIDEFRILKKNSKYTYNIEIILKQSLRLQHFPVIVEDEQILFSFFDDLDWKIIITNKLTLEERELYYSNKKSYIKKIICFLFIESQFPLIVPNYQSNLYVEFNDKLISLYNLSHEDLTNNSLQNIDRKNVACVWYSKFNYTIARLPIYFIYLLSDICNIPNIYYFLLDFFFNFMQYYIGFLFHKKNLAEIQQIDIEKEVSNIISVFTRKLEKNVKSSYFIMTDETFQKLIFMVDNLVLVLLSTIIYSIYLNNEYNSENRSKSKLNFDTVPHLCSEAEYLHIDKFIDFINKIVMYADSNNFNIDKFKSDDLYLFLIPIINILHEIDDSQFIFKFIAHLKNNYLDSLLNLKIILKSKKIVHLFDEYNNIFGRDEFIFFMVYSAVSYSELLIMSENFSKNLEIDYYEYFLEFFKK